MYISLFMIIDIFKKSLRTILEFHFETNMEAWLTLSQLQQICSKHLCKNIEIWNLLVFKYIMKLKHCDRRRNCSWWETSPFATRFSRVVYYRCLNIRLQERKGFYPFPSYNKSAADDFENILVKTWKISINNSIIIK